MKRTYKNFILQDIEDALSKLENKIEDEDYDQYEQGFDEEFNNISIEVQSLTFEDFIEDDDVDVNFFKKRIDRIKNELDLYDEEAELDMMFPNEDDED